MPTIRQLTAVLGFEIDTTPVRQFNAAIKQARKNISNLKTIRGTNVFAKRIRSNMRKARDEISGAVNKNRFIKAIKKWSQTVNNNVLTQKFLSFKKVVSDNIKKAAKAINSPEASKRIEKAFKKLGEKAKNFALAAFAGIATTIAGSIKLFQAFSTEEQAVAQLKFQFQDTFDATNKNINETIKNTGGLVTRLDALNAAAASFEVDTNPEAFNRTLDSAAKFAAILKDKRITDIAQLFAQFRAFGDVEGLKALGLFTSQQLEVLRKAGTELTAVGQVQRTKELDRLLTVVSPRLNKAFDDFSKTSTAASQRLTVSASETTKALGEDAAPIIKDVSKNLASDLDTFRKVLKDTGSVFRAVIAVGNQIGGVPLGRQQPIAPFQGIPITGGVQQQIQPITVNAPITIEGNATEATAGEIQAAIERVFSTVNGTTVQQNKRTTIIRGQNQD